MVRPVSNITRSFYVCVSVMLFLMMRNPRFDVVGWILFYYFVYGVRSEQSPYFSVTGMSDQLSSYCTYNYKQSNISLSVQFVSTGCNLAKQNDSVVNTTWNFYPLTYRNKYAINTEDLISLKQDGFSLNFVSKKAYINSYAIQIIVNVDGDHGSHMHKLNGYINIGCTESQTDQACRINLFNTRLLKSESQRLCTETTSIYKASMSMDFEMSINQGASVDYTEHNLEEAGVKLSGQSSLLFKLQTSGDAYILLHEDKENYLNENKSSEVLLGGKSNTVSEIRQQSQEAAVVKYDEENIVSESEYRSFWISWRDQDIRVGKGELPYAQQILHWDGLSHKINYVSIGTAVGASADWKFNVEICMQDPLKVSCHESDRKAWYYNPDNLSCMETTCIGDVNCFVSSDACREVCGVTSNVTSSPILQLADEDAGVLTRQLLTTQALSFELVDTEESERELNNTEELTRELNDTEISTKELNDTEQLTRELNDTEELTRELNDTEVSTKEFNDTEELTRKLNNTEELTRELNDTELSSKELNDTEQLTRELNNTEEFTRELNDTEVTTKELNATEQLTRELNNAEELTRELNDTEVSTKELNDTEELTRELNNTEQLTRELVDQEVDLGIDMNISCTKNCSDAHNPQKKVQFYLNCVECESNMVSDYQWTVKDCEEMNITSCHGNQMNVTTTGKSKMFSFSKSNDLDVSMFGVFVTVKFKDGKQGQTSQLFRYSPVPSIGSCEISPTTGYSNVTDFTITCTGFTVPEGYSLIYYMHSNTVDEFEKGSLIYQGANSTVNSIKLPPGDSSVNYTLYILVKGMLESGVYVLYSSSIQVLPADANTDNDDSLIDVIISCTKNCSDEHNPQKKVQFYLNCVECQSNKVSDYQWTVKDCEEMNITSCHGNQMNVTTTGESKMFSFSKSDDLDVRMFGVFVTVKFKDGKQGQTSQLFRYSPVPSIGSCEISPTTGYSIVTDFTITCTGFTVPEGYSLIYYMRSNTVDEFEKGSLIYKGANSTVNRIKLPPGDASNNYTLYILVKGMLETGVYVLYSSSLQVLPADANTDNDESVIDVVKDLIDITNAGKNSTINDLLTANKSDEAVQYLSIISSSINADISDDDANKTAEKTMIRTAVVSSLEMVTVDSQDAVSTLTAVLNEATKQVDELSEETQNKAVDMYDNLASNLDAYQGTSTTEELTESAGEILSGVTNLLELKVDKGKEKLSQNISEDANSSEEMQKVKEGTGKLLNTVDKIGGTLLSQKLPGEEATVLITETMAVRVEKKETGTLGGHSMSPGNESSSFKFPTDMSAIDNGSDEFGIQLVHMKKNPYVWDQTANDVNMAVMSVDLKANNGSSVKMENMAEPLKISLKSSDTSVSTNSSLVLHLVKEDSNLTFNVSKPNLMSFNFTVTYGVTTMLKLSPVTNIRKLKIYVSDVMKPSFQNISNHGWLYPEQLKEINSEFSDFKLTDFSSITENISNIFISNKNTSSNYTGVHYVAISVDLDDNSTIEDLSALDPACIGNDLESDCESAVEIVLKVKTTTLSCTYWDVTSDKWRSEGCEVSPYCTSDVLECLCTHMTSFSGGVFVLPNFIDPIADAELFLTFFDNPVVVTTVLVVWMLYFFLIHWARQADKFDQEKVGVIAVDSRGMVNGYNYLMCVVTGWWSEAGTTANVFFHMTGSEGASKRMKLSTSLRSCFLTGYEDWFIVTTEHSLGEIEDVTLWHDNSGNSPHWYLSQVYVKDLRAKKSWTFIYNDWLAVDRGHIFYTTATIAAVSQDELKKKQKHNFLTKSTQDLRNAHIWISIFSKPARSTFTRVQRLTCALSVLLSTMLTNIMFYGVPTDDPDDQVSATWEFSISLSSIVIGIQSSLIMFPVNIFVMQLFLKLKQKPTSNDSIEEKKSRWKMLLDLAYVKSSSIIEKFTRGSSTHHLSDSSSEFYSLGRSEEESLSASEESILSKKSSSLTAVSSQSVTILSEEKQTGKILPWWFLYIAWCLILSISMISSYFVMLYGLKYGYQTSVEWLVSFFTGFSQSAFVMQPLKVFTVAILFTIIFKKPVQFEDFGPEVRIDSDEEFLNTVNVNPEPQTQYSNPLSSKLLQQIKERVQLEWLMNVTLRDIGLYFIYITIVCIVVHGHRDVKKSYYNSLALEDVLINPGCINENNCFFLEKVDTVEYFYLYLNDVAIPNLIDMSIADHDYATPGSSHFLVGPWRLRQLRVTAGSCGAKANELYKQFDMSIPECSGPYWFGNEDNDHYNKSWTSPLSDEQMTDPPTPWMYQSAWKLKTIPFTGRLATYSGGGFIITMPSNTSLHADTINNIWNSDWIDERTRAVFLEFNLYNPNANLFSVVIILFEFSNNGWVIPYHQIFSTKLYHYSTDFGVFVAVCEFLFLFFNISFAYIEWKKFSKLGRKKYFEDFWSSVEIIQIILSFVVVGLFFQRLVFVNGIMNKFREVQGDSFISFYTAISWDLALGYTMAFLVSLVTLKAAKLLRFNKRTFMIADALQHIKGMLISISVMVVFLFIAFSSFGTFAFGKTIPDYRDFLSSLITVLNLSMGVSDLPGLMEANRVLGPMFFVVFVFATMFLFMTMFVAIINFGITESSAMLEQRKNKFELLEYISMKLKTFVNIR